MGKESFAEEDAHLVADHVRAVRIDRRRSRSGRLGDLGPVWRTGSDRGARHRENSGEHGVHGCAQCELRALARGWVIRIGGSVFGGEMHQGQLCSAGLIGSAATTPKSAAVAASLDVDAQPSTGSVRPSLSGDHQVQRGEGGEGKERGRSVVVWMCCVPAGWSGCSAGGARRSGLPTVAAACGGWRHVMVGGQHSHTGPACGLGGGRAQVEECILAADWMPIGFVLVGGGRRAADRQREKGQVTAD